MYIDWVITLSVIILVLTCVFLGYGLYYAVKKIHQADARAQAGGEKDDVTLVNKHA